MVSKILAILAAFARIFFLWDDERKKQRGRQEVKDALTKAENEKIEAANHAAVGDLPDELLIKPKDRGQK